jgi:hypothetical protein
MNRSRCDLRGLLLDVIPIEEACRYREHQAALGRARKVDKSLSWKIHQGKQSAALAVGHGLKRMRQVRLEGDYWLWEAEG